jgi:predicted RNase H-like nuclease (RuvC/YqgF family)
MSSESDRTERIGPPNTETAAAARTEPSPIRAATGERVRPRGVDADHPVSGTRTRVVSLRTEVKLLEAERETLANHVFALEADVAELEAEVADLEGTVEAEERRRQRVIDRYERLIEKREAANRELRGETGSGGGLRNRRTLRAIASSMAAAWTRVKQLVPVG